MRLLLALSLGVAVGFGWHDSDETYAPMPIGIQDLTEVLGCSIWKYRVSAPKEGEPVVATVELLRRGQPPEPLMHLSDHGATTSQEILVAVTMLGHPDETQAESVRIVLDDTACTAEIPNPFRGLVRVRVHPPGQRFDGNSVALIAGWKKRPSEDGDIVIGPDSFADPDVALRVRFGLK